MASVKTVYADLFLQARKDSKYGSAHGAFASQGRSTSNPCPCGLIRFRGLRDGTVDWSAQNIIGISLTCHYRESGAKAEKVIGMYLPQGDDYQNYTGYNYLAVSVGNIPTNGVAHDSTTSMYFASEAHPDAGIPGASNAEAFGVLKVWLERYNTSIICIYKDEQPGSKDYSTNYLGIDSASLTIVYEQKGSEFNVTSPVKCGDTAIVNILSTTSDAYSHSCKVEYNDSSTSLVNIPHDTSTATILIPTEWSSHIQAPNTQDSATFIFNTIRENGTIIGTQESQIIITVPNSSYPQVSASITSSGQEQDKYYQNFTHANLTMIVESDDDSQHLPFNYSITGSDGTSFSGSINALPATISKSTNNFQKSGVVTYTFSVSDSRGLTSRTSLSCTVIDTSTPTLSIMASRCSENTDNPNSFINDATGDYIHFNIAISVYAAGGNNYIKSASIICLHNGTGRTVIPLTGASGTSYSINEISGNQRNLYTSRLDKASTYEFSLSITDASDNIYQSAVVTISPVWAPLHINHTGYGVSVGMIANGTQANPMFEVDESFKSYFYGEVQSPATIYPQTEIKTGGYYIDNDGRRGDVYKRCIQMPVNGDSKWHYSYELTPQVSIDNISAVLKCDFVFFRNGTTPMIINSSFYESNSNYTLLTLGCYGSQTSMSISLGCKSTVSGTMFAIIEYAY